MLSDAAIDQCGQKSKAKVFISYSRKDIDFADHLDITLKARGFEPLIDRTEIYAFEEWWKRVEDLIARADTVIFVLSPDAVRPGSVALKEVGFAASLNKRFAPIVFRPVEDKDVPEALAKLNFIFFDDAARFEQSAGQLAEALNTDISWIRLHTEFGEQARRWSSAGKPGGLLLRSPMLEQAERWISSRPRGAPAPTEETQNFVRQSRHAATQRRNILTGSLAAGLVLAIALAGLAYWQRGIAVEQRDNATRNFRLAQHTAESLVFDIAQGLRDVQGMSAESVRKTLDTAKATFEQLAAAAPDEPSLQRSRSVMLNEFGETYLTLGDLERAIAAYRESLAIAERLAAADPSNSKWQRDLWVSYGRLGDAFVEQGKLDEALKAYRDSLSIAERLSSSEPANAQWQYDTSFSHIKIADVLTAQGKLDEAFHAYQAGLAIRERLVAADPSNTQWQRELSVGLNKLGDLLVLQRNLEEALKIFRDDLAIAQRLAAMDPTNTQWQRDLSISHNKIGDVLAAQGKLDETLEAYRAGLAIRQRLAASDRNNTLWQRDISLSYERIGDALLAQGKLDDALGAFRDSFAIRERLAASAPANTQWQRDLAIAYNKIGDVLLAQGKLEEALQSYRNDLAISQRIASIDASNSQWQRDVSVAYDESATCSWRRASSMRRSMHTATVLASASASPLWTATMRSGSAIWQFLKTK
jgi:tetratricopeptide (TPR) repeat protein